MDTVVLEALEKLDRRINDIELEDDMDFCNYCELSSRAKALGESKYFDRIPEICKREKFRGRLDEIIQWRAKMGMFDLDARDGEFAAMIIIEAQDWYCFYKFTKDAGWYDKNTGPYLAQWAEETSLKGLNEEACSILDAWRETYPLPEELQLPVIVAPISDFTYEILGKIAGFLPRHVEYGTWKKVNEDKNK